jgi:hypothetical protein
MALVAPLPVLSSIGTPAVGWRTSRDLAQIRASRSVVAAREAARVETIAEVTEVALAATTRISAIEALLVARTPHAEARLRHVADAGVAGMASVVLGLERRL